MFIAILFWLAVVIVGELYVNKWHKYAPEDGMLRVIHNALLALAAAGTLSLIVKVIFK
jgi:hypothetical protein